MLRTFRLLVNGCLILASLLIAGSCAEDDQKPIPAYVVSGKSVKILEAGVDNVVDVPVRVVSEDSTGVAGVRVFFSVTAGKATLSDSVATSGSDGVAAISAHLFKTTGSVIITARVPGLKVPTAGSRYFLQATQAKKIAVIVGDKQEVMPNTKPTGPVKFIVTDDFNNPIPNVVVSFAATSGNGKVTYTTQKSGQDGTVTNVFTAGATDPVNTFTAEAGPGISTVLTLYSLQPVIMSKPTAGELDVTLNWSKNINPTFKSYVVYRSEENGADLTPLKEITDPDITSFKDISPLTAKVYKYYVSVKTVAGIEAKSSASLAQSGLYIDLTDVISPLVMKMNRDKSKIFIADRNQKKILILTTENFRKADSLLLSISPAAMTFSNDNTKLYIAVYNTSQYVVVDLATKTVIKTVDLATTFNNKAVSDLFFTSSNELLVTSKGSFTVKIDETNNDAVTKIAGNTISTLTFLGQSGSSLYLEQSSTTPNEILKLKIDDPSMPLLLRSPFGKINGSSGSVVSPDGLSIYTLGGQVISTADLSSSNGQYFDVGVPGVAVTNDGQYLYFPRGEVINKVKTSTLTIEKTIPAANLGSILLSADEHWAFLRYTDNFPVFQQRLYKVNLVR